MKKIGEIEIEFRILDSRIGTKFSFPRYVTQGSAGLDLYACIKESTDLNPMSSILVPSGISIHISDPKVAAMIVPRSGLGYKHGIILGNSVGLIDSDYQGELLIPVLNRSKKNFCIVPGLRIAQIIFFPIIRPKFKKINFFKCSTSRGKEGFGHSDF